MTGGPVDVVIETNIARAHDRKQSLRPPSPSRRSAAPRCSPVSHAAFGQAVNE